MKAEDLKRIVKEKYGEIAKQSDQQNQSSCCGQSSVGDIADIPQNKHLQSYSEREDDTDAKKDLIKKSREISLN
jgi:hypothetical protein